MRSNLCIGGPGLLDVSWWLLQTSEEQGKNGFGEIRKKFFGHAKFEGKWYGTQLLHQLLATKGRSERSDLASQVARMPQSDCHLEPTMVLTNGEDLKSSHGKYHQTLEGPEG